MRVLEVYWSRALSLVCKGALSLHARGEIALPYLCFSEFDAEYSILNYAPPLYYIVSVAKLTASDRADLRTVIGYMSRLWIASLENTFSTSPTPAASLPPPPIQETS
jgi:hypothetical protein